MRPLITSLSRLLTILAITVAMTGLSFAHGPASSDVDESLLAYVEAGGALDDLCGQAGFGAGGSETCDACRLVDGAMMPASDPVVRLWSNAGVLGDTMTAPAALVRRVANPSCPVRAPPVD